MSLSRRPGRTIPVALRLDGAEGPAARLSQEAAQVLIDEVLDRCEPLRAAPVRRRSGRLSAAAVGLAVLIGSGVAAASYVALRRWTAPPLPPALPAERPHARPAGRHVVSPPSAAPAESPRVREPAPPPRPLPRPVDRLADANRLRAQGAWGRARQAYLSVAQAAPTSAEGQTAALAAAGLELEHLDRPREALRRFTRLVPSAPPSVAEEAAWGIVECQRQLRNLPGEAQALRSFLARFPASFLRPRAEARLEALDPR